MRRAFLLFVVFCMGVTTVLAQENFLSSWRTGDDGKLSLPVKGTNWTYHILKSGDTEKQKTTVPTSSETAPHEITGLSPKTNYTIEIEPAGVEYIRFGSKTGEKYGTPERLTRINDWGKIKWESMEYAFAGCSALVLGNSVGEPDLAKVTSCEGMFKGCTNFNSALNTWKMANVENLDKMFDGCTKYNFPMQDWTLAKAKTISFGKTGLSKDNYEKTLIGWAKKATAKDVKFDAADLVYSSEEAATARKELTSRLNWSITGDKHLLFKFKQATYYCKKGETVIVDFELASGIDASKITFTVPSEYDDDKGIIKIADNSAKKILGLKEGKARLTAKVTANGVTLKTVCYIVVNATGEESKFTLTLSKRGDGDGALKVSTTKNGTPLSMGTYQLASGTKLFVDIDCDLTKVTRVLRINDNDETGKLQFGAYEITLDADKKIEAVISKIPEKKKYKVEFEQSTNGTMTVLGKNGQPLTAGQENLTPDGTLVIVSFAPQAPNKLLKFEINDEEISVTGDSHSFTLSKDVKLKATFGQETVKATLTIDGEDHGKVKVGTTVLNAGVNDFVKGTAGKVTVEENAGFRVKKFTVAGDDEIAKAKTGVDVTFDKDIDIVVSYEKIPAEIYTVNIVQPQNGSITVKDAKNTTVSSGAKIEKGTLTITVKPDEKYKLEWLKANDNDITAKVNATTHTATYELNGEVKFTAKFKKDDGAPVEDALLRTISAEPNPFNDLLRIRTRGEVQNIHYRLVSALGLEITKGVLRESETIIRTSDLPSGLYFVLLSAPNGAKETLRIIKR